MKLVARDPSLLKHTSLLASQCPHLLASGTTPLQALATAILSPEPVAAPAPLPMKSV